MGVCEGECVGCTLRDEPLTLMRCHSCRLPWLYEILDGLKHVAKPTTLGLKGKNLFFFLALLPF